MKAKRGWSGYPFLDKRSRKKSAASWWTNGGYRVWVVDRLGLININPELVTDVDKTKSKHPDFGPYNVNFDDGTQVNNVRVR